MRLRGTAAASSLGIAAALAACHLLIDPDRYRGGPDDDGGPGDDGGIDAGMPDAAWADAGPLDPTSVTEGEGAGTGARPVVLVLRAQGVDDFAGVTSVTIEGVTVDTPQHSGDEKWLAVPIHLPVEGTLGDGESQMLTVTLEPGGEEWTVKLLESGLDELDDASGSRDSSSFKALYSRIHVTDDLTLTGDQPVRLRATADIVVDGAIDAAGTISGAAGPGGCAGGAGGTVTGDSATPGLCGTAGGRAGTSGTAGTGGGGGGHAAAGDEGTGGTTGGTATGKVLATPLAGEGGQGGGGGGAGTTNNGGGGGGGGGIVDLGAGGTIVLNGSVAATGGTGGNGGGVLGTASGSGGGGSGGAVLARATAVSGGGSLNAAGGPGGTKGNAGGAGSAGRIRIDVAAAAVPALDTDPSPVRGPRWADSTPVIVNGGDGSLTATLYGEPDTELATTFGSDEPQSVTTDIDGVATVNVTLANGRNRLCALVSATADLTNAESKHCIYVVHLP